MVLKHQWGFSILKDSVYCRQTCLVRAPARVAAPTHVTIGPRFEIEVVPCTELGRYWASKSR